MVLPLLKIKSSFDCLSSKLWKIIRVFEIRFHKNQIVVPYQMYILYSEFTDLNPSCYEEK